MERTKLHFENVVAYKHRQTIQKRAIASKFRSHYNSNFIQLKKKENFLLSRISTCILSVQRRTRYRQTILACFNRNKDVILAYATTSGPKRMRNVSRVNVRDVEEYVACLHKRELNYIKCLSLVKQLKQFSRKDAQDFRTKLSVRLNGLLCPCPGVISQCVPEGSILWDSLVLQFKQCRRSSKKIPLELIILIEDLEWERIFSAIDSKLRRSRPVRGRSTSGDRRRRKVRR